MATENSDRIPRLFAGFFLEKMAAYNSGFVIKLFFYLISARKSFILQN